MRADGVGQVHIYSTVGQLSLFKIAETYLKAIII